MSANMIPHTKPEDIFALSDLDLYKGYAIFETRDEFEKYLQDYQRVHIPRMIRLVTGDFSRSICEGYRGQFHTDNENAGRSFYHR